MDNLEVIDMDLLISLVQARPIIWDKSAEMYKDKKETKNAWKEIFLEIKSDFEELEDAEKYSFGKQVIKKWVNARDAFQKSRKKQKMAARSGSGASTLKTYIYSKQLQFLKKVFKERDTEGSLSANIAPPNERIIEEENNRQTFKNTVSRKRKSCSAELETIQALKEKPDRHSSFFTGIIPSLQNFDDDDEVLELQMAVLQKIASIQQRKKKNLNQLATKIHSPHVTRQQGITSTAGSSCQNIDLSSITSVPYGFSDQQADLCHTMRPVCLGMNQQRIEILGGYYESVKEELQDNDNCYEQIEEDILDETRLSSQVESIGDNQQARSSECTLDILGTQPRQFKRSRQDPETPTYLSENLKYSQTVSSASRQVETEFDVWAKSVGMQLNNMEVCRALNLQLQIQSLITNERLAYEIKKAVSHTSTSSIQTSEFGATVTKLPD